MAKKKTIRLTSTSGKARIAPVDQMKIRQLREARGWSQADAAAVAGFKSPIQWWDMENKPRRDPRVSTLTAVAKALGCKVDDLLRTDSGNPKASKTTGKQTGRKR